MLQQLQTTNSQQADHVTIASVLASYYEGINQMLVIGLQFSIWYNNNNGL